MGVWNPWNPRGAEPSFAEQPLTFYWGRLVWHGYRTRFRLSPSSQIRGRLLRCCARSPTRWHSLGRGRVYADLLYSFVFERADL